MIAHLQESIHPASEMVRPKRKTVWDEKASLGKLEVGDWVEVEYDYQPGTCSDSGVGVVVMLEDALSEFDGECSPEDAQKCYEGQSICAICSYVSLSFLDSQWMSST